MTEQLEKVIATRKHVEMEVRIGREFHKWDARTCPLCSRLVENCSECIFHQFEDAGSRGCVFFASAMGFSPRYTPIEYVLSFLIDLEDYCKRRERE